MDMNQFRNYLAQRANNEGETNKPQHRAFGSYVDSLKAESYSEDSKEKFGELEEKNAPQTERTPLLTNSVEDDDFSLTGRKILEAFEIVNLFCETVMEEHGLNEDSEDIDQIIEDAVNSLKLDEDYGKMPTVGQGPNDEEKRKIQKGETSKMPKAGVEDNLSGKGDQQSNIDAIKVVLGTKKGSAANAAY